MKIEANIFGARHQVETTLAGSSKYHRAAIDGYVDMLCDATKRDTNLANEENGLTPTLLAARYGHLEALRILVGRGGDPEKTCLDGSSALHLAAARNHLNCVSFLVNFGVNMWALDNELHTAKDLAAMEQKKEVLDYLDQMMARQSALNTKSVQKLKEKAKLATEKRLKQMRKAQLKAIKQVEKDERYLVKLSNNRRLLKAAHSLSDIKLVGRADNPISYSPSDRLSSQPSYLCGQSSPSITNFMNHKLNLDRGSRQLNFISPSANKQLQSTNSDESAYGSSVSSSSGYVPVVCSANVASKKACSRPKYSDLVAVQTDEQSRKCNQQVKSKKQHNEQQQQSLKSNSTICTRLRVVGGVSRKVQLKRLLLSNGSSTADLSSVSGSSNETDSQEGEHPPNERADSSGHKQPVESAIKQSEVNRLCNVQPAIKLKLNADHNQSRAQQPASSSSSGSIKWPPAPIMTRTVSEPDFAAALRLSPESPKCGPQEEKQQQVANEPQLVAEQSQRHLLTQCLSQLKMRHQIISRKEQEGAQVKQTACSAANHAKQTNLFHKSSSELIRHQQNAGEFPLKPSIIKQQQKLRCAPADKQNQVNSYQFGLKSETVISVDDSIGSAGSLAKRNSRSPSKSPESPESSASSSLFYSSSYSSSAMEVASKVSNHNATTRVVCQQANKQENEAQANRVPQSGETIATFLISNGLDELSEVFAEERIDLEALMLLSEEDLKSLNILLGPRRKLLKAIENHRLFKQSQTSSAVGPVYVMVDTPL